LGAEAMYYLGMEYHQTQGMAEGQAFVQRAIAKGSRTL
jgi:hypothetical protein